MNEILVVLGAAVINFAFGGVWYTLLGEKWLKAWGLNKSEIDKKDPTPYLVAFIGSVWSSYGLFLIIKHIIPNNIWELLTIAVGGWLFIVVGCGAKRYSFARRSFEAFIIDYLPDFFGFIFMSILIWLSLY